jgi:NAD-dependent DNA ligase
MQVGVKYLNDLIELQERYILARYQYRIGDPRITDGTYDSIHSFMVDNNMLSEYTSRPYDDDPIPYNLLDKYGITTSETEHMRTMDDSVFEYLKEERSQSIRSVTSYRDAWNSFFIDKVGVPLYFSIKCDGVFTKSLYRDGDYVGSLSRGREGEPFDWTNNMRKILPMVLPNVVGELKIYAEVMYSADKLGVLRSKYSGAYKTPKSAAISLLCVEHSNEDYRDLNVYPFGAEGGSWKSLSECNDVLRSYGFTVSPWMVSSECPSEYEGFVVWLKNILDLMAVKSDGVFSDGVVVAVDDLMYEGSWVNQYNSRTIALKMEHWFFNGYVGIVKRIVIEQQAVFCNCKVEIEPIVTRDMCSARYINTFNPSMLFQENLLPGSKVYFVRDSGAINICVSEHDWRQRHEG